MTAPGSAETEHHPRFTVHGSRPRDTLAELGIVVDLIFTFINGSQSKPAKSEHFYVTDKTRLRM